jgi:hypothetical protein
MIMRVKSCVDCVFWVPWKQSRPGYRMGDCRKRAPKVFEKIRDGKAVGVETRFAAMDGGDPDAFCGEGYPRTNREPMLGPTTAAQAEG